MDDQLSSVDFDEAYHQQDLRDMDQDQYDRIVTKRYLQDQNLHGLQDLRDRHDLSTHNDESQHDQISTIQHFDEVQHIRSRSKRVWFHNSTRKGIWQIQIHSRWQRVTLLVYDKWSADEDIRLRWRLIVTMVPECYKQQTMSEILPCARSMSLTEQALGDSRSNCSAGDGPEEQPDLQV